MGEKSTDSEEFVREKLIIECGVDFESRPLLAIFACNFPDPKKIDYDQLLM
jgi:hypothetical protein